MIKVYIKTTDNNCISEIDSSAFLSDPTGWTEIDEGEGERYIYAQTMYLAKPLFDENDCYFYKYVDGEVVERSEEERAEDIPEPVPDSEEVLRNNAKAAQFAYCKFDGLKYIADPERPIPLELPMTVIPNMYYLYEEKRYAAMCRADTIVTKDNFEDVMVEI